MLNILSECCIEVVPIRFIRESILPVGKSKRLKASRKKRREKKCPVCDATSFTNVSTAMVCVKLRPRPLEGLRDTREMLFDIGNRCVPLRNHVKPGLYAYASRTDMAIVKESLTSLTIRMCLLDDENKKLFQTVKLQEKY
ncbi:hypothetical protein M0804_003584 [Polistes exclamans]|nr:hypothetical protein M0804_003584 [Polistes exclamans]